MDRILNRYLSGLLAGAVITACLLLFFSSAVDPYHFLGRGAIELKPALHENLRFHKAYQVKKIIPSLVLLGSSRVYHGLDPDSPAIERGKVVYNMGIPACRISEIAAFLEHGNNVGNVDEAVIGLDFFAFDVKQTSISGMPWGSLYKDEYKPGFLAYFSDALKSTASTKSVVDSIQTLFGKKEKWDFYHENGFLVQDYFDEKVAHVGGYFQTVSFFLDSGIPVDRGGFASYLLSGSTTQGPFSDLRVVIQYAQKHQIALKLFISPIHAVQLEYIKAAGYQDLYDKWREKLIKIVEEEAWPDGYVSLWDFSGYNSITTEAIPDKDDQTSKMTYFLDASHYKKIAGDLILARMFGVNLEKVGNESGFGRLLTSNNFEEHLREEWLARNEFLRRDLNQFKIYESMLEPKNLKLVTPD